MMTVIYVLLIFRTYTPPSLYLTFSDNRMKNDTFYNNFLVGSFRIMSPSQQLMLIVTTLLKSLKYSLGGSLCGNQFYF